MNTKPISLDDIYSLALKCLTINGTDNCDGLSVMDGGQLFLENLTVNSNKITANNNSMIRMFNVNVTGSGDQQIGTQRNGHINMENVTSTHHMYSESVSMFFMKNVKKNGHGLIMMT